MSAQVPLPPSSMTLEQALQQAIADHQSGQLQNAERWYRMILQAQPRHPDANHNLGVLAVQVGQPAAGLSYFRTALESRPEQDQYWLSYVDALSQSGQIDVARQVLEQGRARGLAQQTIATLTARLAQVVPSALEMENLVALFNQGRYAEGEAIARAMSNRFPQHGFGWKLLGAFLKKQGRDAQALAPMRQAASLQPDDAEAHSNLGATLKYLGHLDEAEASLRRAVAIHPGFAAAHYNLGNLFKDQGRLVEAEASYRNTLAANPHDAEVHGNLGNMLKDQGRLIEAEASYRRALQIKPDFALVHNNLGITLHEQGRLEDAVASYRQALEIAPDLAQCHNNLGVTFNDLGRSGEAEATLRRALALMPDYAEAHSNLGIAFKNQGLLAQAERSYRRALEFKPDYAEAHSNLGNTLKEQGRLPEAEVSLRRALALKPNYADAHSNLGNMLKDQGRLAEAEASYRRALAIRPDFAEAHNNLGVVLNEQDRYAEAEASVRRALACRHDYAGAHSNLGHILKDRGRLADAERSYRQALALNLDFSEVHSNLLFVLNYSADHSPEYCLAEAQRYAQQVEKKAQARFTSWLCAPRPERLRVGMVSGDLHSHPVGYFLEGLLARLDSSRIELLAYSTQNNPDALTARIRPCFVAWRSIANMSDAVAAQRIHADGVHILLDLAGHTAYNRLPVFAWKPAPVQASWLGYFATTGLPQMDYLLADEFGVPPDQRQQFVETIWPLPDTRLCFTAPKDALPLAPLPALAKGHITFGCFQNLTKVGEPVLAAWARILAALPSAQLRLQCKQLGSAPEKEQLVQRLLRHGIDPDRVAMHGVVSRETYLAAHAEVDLILDTFPYPGGTTTCEALWMGVPSLSLAGDRLLARQGGSLLKAAGLADWIAVDVDDYVAKGGRFATQLDYLARLRVGLRQQVLESPLFDGARFAGNLENALWRMWQAYQKAQGE